ncbi:MAG TPA: hypothetical protein DCS93_17105 [Microscillaceae bacterium]|nr:hypothetical protein [Microscillaceae bacterium]
MKEDNLTYTTPGQTLLEKGDQLWQKYLISNQAESPESQFDQEDFWNDYQHILQIVKQQQQNYQHKQALVRNEKRFLTNETQYKSLPIPVGKYFYKDLRMSLQGYGLAGLIIVWFFTWVWVFEFTGTYFIRFLNPLQIGFFFFIILKIVNLFRRNSKTTLTITSKYLYDQARNKVVAFKDILTVRKTWFGLKLILPLGKLKRPRSLTIPKKAEEYQNLQHFFEQAAQANTQSSSTYSDLSSLFKSYWPEEDIVTFAPQKKKRWTFKKNKLIQLSITPQSLLFVMSTRRLEHTIDVPLHEIYHLRKSRRHLKILDKNKNSKWPTTDVHFANFRLILEQNLRDFHKIRIFLEEVVIFNNHS